MLGYLVSLLPWKQRLELADYVLPQQQTPAKAEAAVRFRTNRSGWLKFALIGYAGALAALLGTASWDGAAASAAKALTTSALGFVLALSLGVLSAGLAMLEDYLRSDLVHRRVQPDDEWTSAEDFHHAHLEEEWHGDHASKTIPAAIGWYLSDRGATIFLIASALVFLGSTLDAVVRLGSA